MNLDKRSLFAMFVIALALTLFAPSLMPSLKILFFAPFLIVSYYQRNFVTCLWYSLLCGMCLDLITSELRFGIYAIDFTAVTFLLYQQKKHFFADTISTLPIMTYLFSAISALFLLFFSYIFKQSPVSSWQWIFTDALLMPLNDVLYATLLFVLPSLLLGKKIRKGNEYFH